MLSVTHSMSVLVLLSVVRVGMQLCMMGYQNEIHKLQRNQEWMQIYAANNKQY